MGQGVRGIDRERPIVERSMGCLGDHRDFLFGPGHLGDPLRDDHSLVGNRVALDLDVFAISL